MAAVNSVSINHPFSCKKYNENIVYCRYCLMYDLYFYSVGSKQKKKILFNGKEQLTIYSQTNILLQDGKNSDIQQNKIVCAALQILNAFNGFFLCALRVL